MGWNYLSQCSKYVWKNDRPSEMICQPNNWNMLQMLENSSAQAIYYRPQSDRYFEHWSHYCDIIMGSMASVITSLMSVKSTVNSGADQRKHQNSASLAFVRGIHRRPVNSPHKWPVTRKMFPFDDAIMNPLSNIYSCMVELWEFPSHTL